MIARGRRQGATIISAPEMTLTFWKEIYDQPRQHIKKERHILSSEVCIVKAMIFPVVMCGCESWTINKAEHRRIDAFEL